MGDVVRVTWMQILRVLCWVISCFAMVSFVFMVCLPVGATGFDLLTCLAVLWAALVLLVLTLIAEGLKSILESLKSPPQ